MAVDYGTDDVEEIPRGSGGPIWLTPKEKGFKTVEFDDEQAAEIGHVLKVIGRQWSRLTVMTIIDLLTSQPCDKGRFELQAEALDEETKNGRGTNWHLTRIRAS